MEKCACAEGLRTFSVEKALDYLLAEKLFGVVSRSEYDPNLAAELPKFVAEIRRLFTGEEISTYLDQLQKRKYRRRRQLETDIEDASLDTLMAIAESQRFYCIRELLHS